MIQRTTRVLMEVSIVRYFSHLQISAVLHTDESVINYFDLKCLSIDISIQSRERTIERQKKKQMQLFWKFNVWNSFGWNILISQLHFFPWNLRWFKIQKRSPKNKLFLSWRNFTDLQRCEQIKARWKWHQLNSIKMIYFFSRLE